MRRYKNGVTHYDADDIDAFLGIHPQPINDSEPIVARFGDGKRTHVAASVLEDRTLCGLDLGRADRIYAHSDKRYARRKLPCRRCDALASSAGITSLWRT